MIDGTLETLDGRPALRFERRLAHPVQRVWRAVSEPAELELWFPAAADWTPAVGETFVAGGATGRVTEVQPPHVLGWEFNGDLYRFELTARDDGCLLVFTHVFDDRSIAAQSAAGWHAYLARLEPHLDGRPLSEKEAHEGWADIHEGYAERFGVDPAPGRRFIAK
jgi:uncharacterized protein YndB with AHSA1/START domain